MRQVSRWDTSPAFSEPRDWWRTNRSLTEIADHLQRTVADKQELQQRLDEVLHENARLIQANAELAGERSRRPVRDGSQAKLVAKERLLKDELIRTIQSLQVELKQERERLGKRVEDLTMALSTCLCSGNIEKRVAPKAKSIVEIDPWLGRDRR